MNHLYVYALYALNVQWILHLPKKEHLINIHLPVMLSSSVMPPISVQQEHSML